jgi:hypothetical protein
VILEQGFTAKIAAIAEEDMRGCATGMGASSEA